MDLTAEIASRVAVNPGLSETVSPPVESESSAVTQILCLDSDGSIKIGSNPVLVKSGLKRSNGSDLNSKVELLYEYPSYRENSLAAGRQLHTIFYCFYLNKLRRALTA